VAAAIDITCHDHSTLLLSVRYYIFFSKLRYLFVVIIALSRHVMVLVP